MQITCKNGNVLEKVAVINRPTYVKHNAYGNIHYYSVLEPKTDVTLDDLRDEKIRKAYSKYKSTEEIANDFYKWNPEDKSVTLNDYKSIHFLGHEYIYRPHHKTYYGNVDRLYFLLPIIARWYYIVTDKNLEDVLDDSYLLPRGYMSGESKGFHYSLGASDTEMTSDKKVSDENFFIPMVGNDTPARAIACMNVPSHVFTALDELISRPCCLNINLNGAYPESYVSTYEEFGVKHLYVASYGKVPSMVAGCKVMMITSDYNVTICEVITDMDEKELNKQIMNGGVEW